MGTSVWGGHGAVTKAREEVSVLEERGGQVEMWFGKCQVSGILPEARIRFQPGSEWGSLGSWVLLRNPNSQLQV